MKHSLIVYTGMPYTKIKMLNSKVKIYSTSPSFYNSLAFPCLLKDKCSSFFLVTCDKAVSLCSEALHTFLRLSTFLLLEEAMPTSGESPR